MFMFTIYLSIYKKVLITIGFGIGSEEENFEGSDVGGFGSNFTSGPNE